MCLVFCLINLIETLLLFLPCSRYIIWEPLFFKTAEVWVHLRSNIGLSCWLIAKESACNAGGLGSTPGLGWFPWRRGWQPTPVFLPGESHAQRIRAGYSTWGRKESDTTEWLTLSLALGTIWVCSLVQEHYCVSLADNVVIKWQNEQDYLWHVFASSAARFDFILIRVKRDGSSTLATDTSLSQVPSLSSAKASPPACWTRSLSHPSVAQVLSWPPRWPQCPQGRAESIALCWEGLARASSLHPTPRTQHLREVTAATSIPASQWWVPGELCSRLTLRMTAG